MLLRISLLSVAAAVGLTACSSAGGEEASTGPGRPSSAASSASGAAPEDVIAPDDAVATGLKGLKVLAGQIAQAAASDSGRAKTLAEGLEELWEPVEGTVKKNAADTYLTIEDAFAALESGDAARARDDASDLSVAVDSYLAAHPG